jgi:hypothetical protein
MIEVEAFLARLRQISAHPALRDERSVRAIELFELYRKRLYARYRMDSPQRPTPCDKQHVDRTLAELRQLILRAEVGTQANSRLVFTAVRHRIDMTRRALAALIPLETAGAEPTEAQRAENEDRIGARRDGILDRRIVLRSLLATI